MRVGGVNAGYDAIRMVVGFETNHSRLICYTITHIKRRFADQDRIMILRLGFLSLVLLATPLSAGAPRVATDILPVHSLVARVMEGVGTPDLILPPGASPHGYAMRPSEAAALEQADVVFWIGPALTPWLAGPIENLAREATKVAFLEDGGEHQEGRDDEHGHGDADPHVWLDPENAREWLGDIALALSEEDPENAARYLENTKMAQADISELIAKVSTALTPIRADNFVVYHDALGHFERRFDIAPRFALLSSDAEKPTPRRIAELRQRVAEQEIRLIFTEPMAAAELIETVFEGRSAKLCEVDLVGAGVPRGSDHYWQTLLNLAETMGRCGQDGTAIDKKMSE